MLVHVQKIKIKIKGNFCLSWTFSLITDEDGSLTSYNYVKNGFDI
jgi:hypothetical protein